MYHLPSVAGLQFRADTGVALLNGMMHTIVAEGLVNEFYVKKYTEGFERMPEHLKD